MARRRLSNSDHLFQGRKRCLSTGEEFLAVLLRLRLGLLGDVADWFSISSFKNYDALLSAVADAGRALGQRDEKRIRACAAAASTDSDAGPGV